MKRLKQVLNLVTTLLTIIVVTSCGGEGIKKDTVAKVKPEKVEISGDLSRYLQVVDNEYEVTPDNIWGGYLSIKIKATQALTEYELKENDFEIRASLLNENGMPVSGTGEFKIVNDSKDKLVSLLKKGSGEEVIQLRTTYADDYKAEEHADKSKKFSVSSLMKEKKESTFSSSENTTSSTDENVLSGDSENWDKILSDYSSFIDKYISLMQKAKSGDASAMGEYADVMQQAQELGDKLQNAQNDLTPTQASKFIKLQTKLAETALQMAK